MLAWRVFEKVLEVSIVQAVVRRDVVGVPFLVVLRRTLLAAEHPESGIVFLFYNWTARITAECQGLIGRQTPTFGLLCLCLLLLFFLLTLDSAFYYSSTYPRRIFYYVQHNDDDDGVLLPLGVEAADQKLSESSSSFSSVKLPTPSSLLLYQYYRSVLLFLRPFPPNFRQK